MLAGGTLRSLPALLPFSFHLAFWLLLSFARHTLVSLSGFSFYCAVVCLSAPISRDPAVASHAEAGLVLLKETGRPSSSPNTSRRESRKARISSPALSTHPASVHNVRALGDRLLPAPALRTWRPLPTRFGSWIASGSFHLD